MLEFEFEGIPFTDDHPYADSTIKFYVRAGVNSLNNYIKVWNEQTLKNGDVNNIEIKTEAMGRYNQEAEISVSFYLD